DRKPSGSGNGPMVPRPACSNLFSRRKFFRKVSSSIMRSKLRSRCFSSSAGLEQLALRLSSIYLVAQELTLRIGFSNNQTNASAARTYERVFKIPEPTNDVDLLFRMLQTYLENFKSEHPIVAVALTAQPIRPASQQVGLFETT